MTATGVEPLSDLHRPIVNEKNVLPYLCNCRLLDVEHSYQQLFMITAVD